MNVGFVTDFYYPWVGGPAAVVRNLAQGLAVRRHAVSILAPSTDGAPAEELDDDLPIRRARTVPIPVGYRLRVASTPAAAAARWIADRRPDVVHVHHPFPLSAAAVLLARQKGIPVVATNHTIPECSLWGVREHRIPYRLLTAGLAGWIVWMLDRCDVVTTPTLTAAEALHAMGYHRPVTPISNGVDTQRFCPGPRPAGLARRLGLDGRPAVLYTGRLDAEKQMDVWIHAASILSRRLDVQFLVGGNGPERPRLERLARDLGLDGRVRFLGYLHDDFFPLVYRLADVYCITSPVELQSIGTLEAIASGLPAVGVRAGALPELIRDGDNGLLAEPGDAGGVAAALEAVLRRPEAAGRMAGASRTIARHHDLGETVARYEALFETTLAGKRGALP